MTLDKKDKEILIDYRISQAEQTIIEVKRLIELDMNTIAVSRIYYGIFYCLLALSLKHDFNTSKHQRLLGWFNKNFISSGAIDKKYGKIAHQSYQNRIKCDYDAFVKFEKDEIIKIANDMELFVAQIKKHILK